MEPVDRESELLQNAIHAFYDETGLTVKIVEKQIEIDGLKIDAIIKLPHHNQKLAVEVKKWVQHTSLEAIASQVKRLPIEGLLIADYINPNMGKRLQAMDIQYFDTAGNAYINHPPMYIQVNGNKQRSIQNNTKAEINRAFDAAGLKVIFGFLCCPTLVTATYRDIAKNTGVALGTVNKVIKGLKDAGFIVDRGRGKRRLVNIQKMLDRWVEAYPEKLKPKLHLGEYIAEEPDWWKELPIEKYKAFWGGELAAAKYTHYLKPQSITVYLPESAKSTLLAKARLKKYRRDNTKPWVRYEPNIVNLYHAFWPVSQEQSDNTIAYNQNELVSPILIYADLITTGDSRNLETARMIYEQFIAKHIGEA